MRYKSFLCALLVSGTAAQGLSSAQTRARTPSRARTPHYEEMLRRRGYSSQQIEAERRRFRELWGGDTTSRPFDRLKEQVVNPFDVTSRRRRIDPERFNLMWEPERRLTMRRAEPEYVEWVQAALNRAVHADLKLDGFAGPRTEQAVRHFQETHGLRVDGIVGSQTERSLIRATNSLPPRPYGPRSRFSPFTRSRFRDVKNLRASELLDDALYIDVRDENGTKRVLAWLGALKSAPPNPIDPSWLDAKRIDGPEELLELLSRQTGSENPAVVSAGEPLSRDWTDSIKSAGFKHVHVSQRSPKQTLGEHAAAASALDRTFRRDDTRIFSALPRARGSRELIEEIEDLGLRRDEAPSWRLFSRSMGALEEAGTRVETAEKAAVLDELQNGTANTVVLFAHSQYGNIRLPRGELLTPEELDAIRRDAAPDRTIVLISCDVGEVNAQVDSVAEILLRNKTASNVVAAPQPVSAKRIPDMIRRFVQGGETLNDVFNGIGYQTITEQLEEEPLVAHAG